MTERATGTTRGRRQKLDDAAHHDLDLVDRVMAGVQVETAADAELADFTLRLRTARASTPDATRERLDARFMERMQADRREAKSRPVGLKGRFAAVAFAGHGNRAKLAGAGALATMLVCVAVAGSFISGDRNESVLNETSVSPEMGETLQTRRTDATAKSLPQAGPLEAVSSDGAGSAVDGRQTEGSSLDKFLSATPNSVTPNSTAPIDGIRRVERSANLTLAAAGSKVEDVADKVISTTDRFGGYVVNSSVSGGDAGRSSAEFELKLPAERFQQALAAYSGLAHVRERTQQTQDITDPYRRATSALSSARAEADRLRALLTKSSDAEAPAVRSRLRAAERRVTARGASLNRLRNRVNFVSLGVTIVADETVGASDRGTIGRALDKAVDVLAAIAAFMIVALAVVVPPALVVLAVIVGRRRFNRARRDLLINDVAAPAESSG